MTASTERAKWHVSREIPLSLIYLFAGQLIGAVAFVSIWWASTQRDVTEISRRVATIENQKLAERIVSLEQQMADAKRIMERMDSKLDRLLERGAERKGN
jgi:hypothetical protein